MKGTVVLLVIAIAVAISTLLHAGKMGQSTEQMDKLRMALAPAARIIPQGAHIQFATEPGNIELYTQARFIMAPTLLQPVDSTFAFDTLLAIQYKLGGDTLLAQRVQSYSRLWQHTDDRYIYTIITHGNR
jgi:hypothetical protein